MCLPTAGQPRVENLEGRNEIVKGEGTSPRLGDALRVRLETGEADGFRLASKGRGVKGIILNSAEGGRAAWPSPNGRLREGFIFVAGVCECAYRLTI